MSDQFETYYQRLLVREGGDTFTDYKYDRGGATKFGITLVTLRRLSVDMDGDGDIDALDVELLDNDTARSIYKEEYFQGPCIDKLPNYLQEIAFDMAVHFGPRGGIRVLQETANSRLHSKEHIAEDGVIGPNTITALAVAGVQPKRVAAFRVKRLAAIFVNHYAEKETNIWYGFFNRGLQPFELVQQ